VYEQVAVPELSATTPELPQVGAEPVEVKVTVPVGVAPEPVTFDVKVVVGLVTTVSDDGEALSEVELAAGATVMVNDELVEARKLLPDGV
jgi:hypothetical protein